MLQQDQLEEKLQAFGRLMDTKVRQEEKETEKSLRPRTFDEYIGQEEVKENLKLFITAAKQRKVKWV